MLLPNDLSYTWDSDFEPSLAKGSSDAFFLVGWKKASGKFDMEKLLPEVTYEIAFVIMLLEKLNKDGRYVEYKKVDQLESILADEKREHKMKDMPMTKWIETLGGELRRSYGQCGEIIFSLETYIAGARVALRSVIIRPKETVA